MVLLVSFRLTKECEYYHSPSYPVVCLGIGWIFIYLGGRFNFPAYFFLKKIMKMEKYLTISSLMVCLMPIVTISFSFFASLWNTDRGIACYMTLDILRIEQF